MTWSCSWSGPAEDYRFDPSPQLEHLAGGERERQHVEAVGEFLGELATACQKGERIAVSAQGSFNRDPDPGGDSLTISFRTLPPAPESSG